MVEGARLESVCTPKAYRGFESLPLRQLRKRPVLGPVFFVTRWREGMSNRIRTSPFVLVLLTIFVSVASGCASAGGDGEPRDLPIVQQWSGDYPVAELQRLPEGQRETGVGYIGDAVTFATVWQVFKPGEKVPQIDFDQRLVVFSRNLNYYNRTSIAKVTLENEVVEVIAIETMSALPIGEDVAMAMAVIPRAGVRFIGGGTKRIPL